MKIFKFLVAVTIGAFYGLLFAQKPGKKFREELKGADNPVKTVFNEFKEVDMEALETTIEWAKESEDLQNLFRASKSQFGNLVKKTRKMGTESRKIVREKLEKLSQEAKEAAEELKETVVETGEELKRDAEKGMKTIAKKIGK